MSRLSEEDVDRVAGLARLELTGDERALFADQLGAILEYAGQLARVETAGIDPYAHAPVDRLTERPDRPAPCLPRDEALGLAPVADTAAGLFRVPRAVGG